MPRQRSGRPAARPMGRSASPPHPSGSRPYSTSTSTASPPPAAGATSTAPMPQAPHVPAQSSGGGMMSGLMGTVAQGMALGTGSAIAHRTIDSAWGAMFGGSSGGHVEPAQVQAGAQQLQQAQHPCADAAQQFADCMSKSGGDMGACDQMYNAMQQCKMQHA
eukprot:jgi/Ulvmu1/323/UM001_0327.1